MIWGAVLAAAMLSTCVLSLPVTSGQLENEDVKVVKCIVEVLVDVLSRPHPVPVSQECLVTLKTDDRLVRILRHRNFLKELQEIALQGGQERAQLQRDTATPDTTTQSSQTTDDIADRSMLEALGGPGERSILSQTSRTGNEDGEGEKDENRRGGESQESSDITEGEQVKRKDDESPESHVSESVDEWSDGKAEKRVEEEEDEEEESEEKRTNSKENSEEGNMTKDKSAASDEERDAPRNKSKEKKLEEEEEDEKRSALFSHKQDEEQREEGEMRRDSRESLKPWTKKGSGLQLKKKEKPGKEKQHLKGQQQEVPHHSKEVTEDEEEEEKKKKRNTERSPEEKELQLIARRAPEERRGSEEEGSASRKAEEPEIESLAAIESELENVAQKLHELWRGRERD